MIYRWCCSVVGVTPGLAVAAGGQVAFRAPGGLPGASVMAVGAVLLLLSVPGFREWFHVFALVALRAV